MQSVGRWVAGRLTGTSAATTNGCQRATHAGGPTRGSVGWRHLLGMRLHGSSGSALTTNRPPRTDTSLTARSPDIAQSAARPMPVPAEGPVGHGLAATEAYLSGANSHRNQPLGTHSGFRGGLRQAYHLGLVFGSQGSERALAFLAVTIVLRELPGPAGGSFVLMLKVAGFAGVLATLGLQAGAVRLVSEAFGEGRERWADALLRAFLLTRLASAGVLVACGVLGSSWLAAHVFGHPAIAGFIQWGCISAASNAILMFSLHHLQAKQLFVLYAVLTILAALTRMSAVLVLILAGMLSAYHAAVLWALLPGAGALLGLCLAPRGFLARPRPGESRQARTELMALGRWLTASAILSVAFQNLDSFVVTRYLGLRAVGWYGAAINLSLIVVILATSLFTVLLPAFSRITDRCQLRQYFWRTLLGTTAGASLLLPALWAAPWLMRSIYGSGFLPAVSAFRFLFAGALLSVIYGATSIIFLAVRKPVHLAGQAAVQLAVSVPFYLVLIPREGIVGGAVGTFVGQLAALLYVLSAAPAILREEGPSDCKLAEPGHAG